MIPSTLADTLRSLPFPEEFAVNKSANEINRTLFQLSLLIQRLKPPFSLIDLGAGMGSFPVACAEVGIDVTAVDDYADPYDAVLVSKALDVLRLHGVKILAHNVLAGPLPFAENSIDAITSFGSMEHWHHSPKHLFAQCMKILKPGGVFLLSGPNCVNLRKRLSVPLGYGKWTQMADWYEQDVFRGHVREPDVDDLKYIARDLKLINISIYGRNFIGMSSQRPMIRAATKIIDHLLRLRPSLCSDIYMIGNKP